ncbi:hypothetical protein C8J55DRAFT_438969 [Lentinula edodes]|uniref:Tc1-like transposase DDE domain-containing protein n=1 Tax=Lentinula lateritia TaxID=40482 RepID=A0A9W8ZUE9_9AGAR|nr:hypothetical protein C8J55DRAFT_438969 [Lentinula edodes]
MHYFFLPPYSPDCNPVELGFSCIKSFVQREGEIVRQDLHPSIDYTYVYLHLIRATYSIASNDACGFFNHCGYTIL